MRKSFTVQTHSTSVRMLPAAWSGLRQLLWPPVAVLLLCCFLLAAAYTVPWQTTQDVGERAPLLSDLYADEQNAQFTYAYTAGDAVVSLPQLGRGSFAVSLTGGAPQENSVRYVVLRVGQDGYPLGNLRSIRTHHLLLNNLSGNADVYIETQAAPSGADPRPLGILVDTLAVRAFQPMGIPDNVRNTVVIFTALLWLLLLPTVPTARRRLLVLLGCSLAACSVFIIGRGTWDIPVLWLYRVLGLLGLGLIAYRLRGLDRRLVPRPAYGLLVFGAAFLLFSRRPDAVLNAQFWAEDGAIWYRSAYTWGPLNALLTPHTGYFQTLPRLVAALSLWFPLDRAPLIFNLVAVGIQTLPVVLLLSSRFAYAVPQFGARVLLACAYIIVPNQETHSNLTNAQWHLALTAAMVVFAQPSTHTAWRCFDIAVVALAAVSGPFSLILAPISLLRSFVRRDRRLLYLGLVLGAGAVVQLAALILPSSSPRPDNPVPLGASLGLFSRILGGQIFAQSVLSPAGYGWLGAQSLWLGPLPAVVALAGLGLLAYALWRGSLELRLFTLFSALIMLGALLTPVTGSTGSQWEALALPGVGLRYWRIPVLAFMLVLGYLAYHAPARVVRRIAVVVLIAAAVGNLYQWRYDPWADLLWRENARAFAAATPGSSVSIPIHPHGWTLSLVKH